MVHQNNIISSTLQIVSFNAGTTCSQEAHTIILHKNTTWMFYELFYEINM